MPNRKLKLGFLDLPFELRCIVYENFFSKSYTLPPSRRTDFWAPLDDTELLSLPGCHTNPQLCKHLHRTDAALLHASPLIRHEASQTLYKTSTFRFCINSYRSNSSSAPRPHAAERMRHVEIILDMWEYVAARNQEEKKTHHPSIDHLCVNTIDHLRLPAPTRKSCRVVFRNLCICTDFRRHAPFLFWNMRTFRGFEKVVVEITPGVHLCRVRVDQALSGPLRVVDESFTWWLLLWWDCGEEFRKQLGVESKGAHGRINRSVLSWEFHPKRGCSSAV